MTPLSDQPNLPTDLVEKANEGWLAWIEIEGFWFAIKPADSPVLLNRTPAQHYVTIAPAGRVPDEAMGKARLWAESQYPAIATKIFESEAMAGHWFELLNGIGMMKRPGQSHSHVVFCKDQAERAEALLNWAAKALKMYNQQKEG